ncbi:unnamed protein product [Zymoseptoria tritici ST99CH_3D1]|nr:unnamed protein product [Zymoseptoria tritici ST99CH_3D1]
MVHNQIDERLNRIRPSVSEHTASMGWADSDQSIDHSGAAFAVFVAVMSVHVGFCDVLPPQLTRSTPGYVESADPERIVYEPEGHLETANTTAKTTGTGAYFVLPSGSRAQWTGDGRA